MLESFQDLMLVKKPDTNSIHLVILFVHKIVSESLDYRPYKILL